MRSFVIFVMAFSLSAIANEKQKQQHSTPAGSVAKESAVVIPVEGMTCMSCVAGIKGKLKGVDGINSVDISLKDRNARVTYQEGKISADKIAKLISELGYKTGFPMPEMKR